MYQSCNLSGTNKQLVATLFRSRFYPRSLATLDGLKGKEGNKTPRWDFVTVFFKKSVPRSSTRLQRL